MKDQVQLSQTNVGLVVQIKGAAGMDVAHELQQRLLAEAVNGAVLIDWSEAEHVESCVFQVLLAYRKQILAAGHQMNVQGDSARVRGYLEMGGFSELFPVRDNLQAQFPDQTADA